MCQEPGCLPSSFMRMLRVGGGERQPHLRPAGPPPPSSPPHRGQGCLELGKKPPENLLQKNHKTPFLKPCGSCFYNF